MDMSYFVTKPFQYERNCWLVTYDKTLSMVKAEILIKKNVSMYYQILWMPWLLIEDSILIALGMYSLQQFRIIQTRRRLLICNMKSFLSRAVIYIKYTYTQ